MQILNLNEEEVLASAKTTFPDDVIHMDHCDLFLNTIEKGEITIDGIEYPLYVNTNYVYEDHLINNNKTRYKVAVTLVSLKKDPYEVIYDSTAKSYVAYLDETIQFVLYEEFQAFLAPMVHIV